MATNYYRREVDRMPQVILWFLTGIVCLLAGWLLPVSLKSIHPALLEFAGKSGPSVSKIATDYLSEQKFGPAAMFVDLNKQLRTDEARQLEIALDQARKTQPSMYYWGGRDRQVEALFSTNYYASEISLLKVFMSDQVRQVVYPYLTDSTQPGVQAIVRTRELEAYKRFVPANKPGGQPLDATIVLAGLFYGSELLAQSFEDEIKAMAETAFTSQNPEQLEEVYYALLVLGNRMNWVQLTEVLHSFENTTDLRRFATLINDRPDDSSLIYCATLMSESPGEVVDYIERFDAEGIENIRRAVAAGAPAVAMLLDRQVVVAAVPGEGLPLAAPWIIKWPFEMFIAKCVLFVFGGLSLLISWMNLSGTPKTAGGNSSLFGLQSQIPYGDANVVEPTTPGNGFRIITRGALIVVLLGGLAFLSEPMLMRGLKDAKPASPEGFRFAGLSNSPVPSENSNKQAPRTMDQSTIISIMLFGLIQILVYMICLMKIREIDLQAAPASLKLRLMENEENLFDSGLYVGIAGTAAALVMQVMQVIEANLLAAYSSNLFGIVCVALVKIGHVRGFKRNLILQMQSEQTAIGSQPAT